MTLKELKEWVNGLPENFDEYSVFNAEYTKVEDEYFYRHDKPVTMLTVSQTTNEILILNEVYDEENESQESEENTNEGDNSEEQ